MKNAELFKSGVYLFPFTVEAAMMYHILSGNGITPCGIFDNADRLVGKDYGGCKIQKPFDTDVPVVICGHRHYDHLLVNANQIKIEDILEHDDVTQAIAQIDANAIETLAPNQVYRFRRFCEDIKQVLLPPELLANDDGLILPSLQIALTEKCTLKCRDCSNLMQYYEHPRHIPLKQIMAEIEQLYKNVDYVRNVLIIGGEPLIYPELEDFLKQIKNYRQKMGVVWLTTNATVLPSKNVFQLLRENNILLRLSHYGKLSIKNNAIIEMCKKTSVSYEENKWEYLQWRKEMAPTYPPCVDDKQNQTRYEKCKARICENSIMDGKFYFCQFLAHMEILYGMPYNTENSLPLTADKEELRRYLERKTFLPGCAYCSGDNMEMPFIEPAIQTKKPLPYASFKDTYKYEQFYYPGRYS